MNEDDMKEIQAKIAQLEEGEVATTDLGNMMATFHQTLVSRGINSMEATLLTSVYLATITSPPRK